MRTLTSRQRAFVAEFIANGGNATAAYRKEYPNTKGEKTASAQGARLKRHPLIAQQLLAAQIATERAVQIAVDRYQITAERVADAMAAPADIREVCEALGAWLEGVEGNG
jgi:phage terminase small subunit